MYYPHPDDELPFDEKPWVDNLPEGGFPEHDTSVPQLKCEGCHARYHFCQDIELLFNEQINAELLAEQMAQLPQDDLEETETPPMPEDPPDGWRVMSPHDYYPRWLRSFHALNECPRAVEDVPEVGR